MKELYPLEGVVAIPQTPFDEAGRVDLERLARAVGDRLQIEDGIALHNDEIGWRAA